MSPWTRQAYAATILTTVSEPGESVEPLKGAPVPLLEQRLIAILRADSSDRLMPVLEVLFEGGLRTVELTMTTAGALDSMRGALTGAPNDAWIGMGTVLNRTTAEQAIKAGARFVVSPIVDEEVIAACVERRVPALAGAATPTEMVRARRAGASAVKVFPASVYGPTFLRQVLAPLPDLPLVPTGGIDIDQVPDYIRAGAMAVGLGGSLIGDAMAGADLTELKERARLALKLAASTRRDR
jgi:2-dehydro-3-deoxyphosphogluconate aldolase / (4S)-4-hydroxy-2-oxoglutarate aldolase